MSTGCIYLAAFIPGVLQAPIKPLATISMNSTPSSEDLVRPSIHDTSMAYSDSQRSLVMDDDADEPDRGFGTDDDDSRMSFGPTVLSSEQCQPEQYAKLYPILVPQKRTPSLPKDTPTKQKDAKAPEPKRRGSSYGHESASKRKETGARKSQGTASSSLLHPIYLVLAGICILCAVYICSFRMQDPVPTNRRVMTLRDHLRSLKDKFPGQPEHNWQIIRSSVMDMLNGSDVFTGPAVILLLASAKNERFASCLSEKVAMALSYTFEDDGEYGRITADDLQVSEDVARHVIENRCRETVEHLRQHVVLASHLEQWNPDAAMMLHPLCDQENARYKNVTYILTAFTRHEDVANRRERREYDRLAENALNHAWAAMDTNQRHAIISRVTGNVVLVREDAASCVEPR